MGCSLDCDENEVCVVTVNGTELCVCQDGYFYNDNTDSCERKLGVANMVLGEEVSASRLIRGFTVRISH